MRYPDHTIWSQRLNGHCAVIQLVNGMYRYRIYQLWPGKDGQPDLGPMKATDSYHTLEEAKTVALETLGNVSI
jgi:hypothetical protein